MNNTIKDFKNGLGYIYVTEADGTTFVKVYPNTPDGGLAAQKFVYFSAPLAGNISATGKFSLTGGAGTITSITVNGVNILGSTAKGGTLALLAADAVNIINNYSSTPDYKATVHGDEIIIQALPTAGSGPNSYVVAGAVTGTVTYTTENMSGGTDVQGLYDASYGYRTFLNADYDADGCTGEGTATFTSLTNAIEITKYLVNRGFQTSFIEVNEVISNGGIVMDRESSTTILYVDTEAAAASDDLDYIAPINFNENDLLVIRGTNAGRVVTVKHGTGNFYLANSTDFSSGNSTKVLVLRFINGIWYEECRAPFNAISISYLRSLNIAIPIQGVETTALPTSGTITLQAGVDKAYQIFDGSPNLVGSVVIEGKILPGLDIEPVDGDEFWVKYKATPTVGVNTVTILGITLTKLQAESGLITVYSRYDGTNNVWVSTIIQEANGVTFATTTDLSASVKEFVFVDAFNTTTGANETMYSYYLPANTLVNDGDYVKITGLFKTTNNTQVKSMYIAIDNTVCSTVTGEINNEYCLITVEINKIDSVYQLVQSTNIRTDSTKIEYNKLSKDVTSVLEIKWIVNAATSVSDIKLVSIKVESFSKQ